MDKNNHQRYVTPNGKKSSLIDKIFEVYIRIAMVWVIGALCFDIYMIIKHFKEFGFN
jgi:hypothetical protein